ncbi:hypothetical protein [Jatrophihabitans lederbergiae]|uniref:Uncharacterized protein n=1 Tax=Jatrophihabitans lederbergiae TaxID=3075547 RepID=A0ABU2JH58_9ACTN|nr:hypothetical protein [Jatrophihabitans sp. DSM 44399]MDT0264326.1 hypothetical protein [Jatrophihabitans sp. DSM 44399]
MSKSNEPTNAVPAMTGDTVTSAQAHISSKLETVSGTVVATKEDRCPAWCISDHTGTTANGYDCYTGGTVINLPNHVGDNAVNGRNVPWSPERRGHSIEVRRSRWTVEQTDDHEDDRWMGSTDECIELSVDGFDGLGMNDDEVETLIGVLRLTLDQKRRYQLAEDQRFTR